MQYTSITKKNVPANNCHHKAIRAETPPLPDKIRTHLPSHDSTTSSKPSLHSSLGAVGPERQERSWPGTEQVPVDLRKLFDLSS